MQIRRHHNVLGSIDLLFMTATFLSNEVVSVSVSEKRFPRNLPVHAREREKGRHEMRFIFRSGRGPRLVGLGGGKEFLYTP